MMQRRGGGIGEWRLKYAPTNGSADLGFFFSVERGAGFG